MLEIKNLRVVYKNKKAAKVVYDAFDFAVRDGEVTCVLGESGSGKTTLLNCIAGLIKYDGEITKAKCSYVFQEPRLVPQLTVLSNLKLVCRDEDAIMEILEEVGLEDKAKSYPSQLSGGEAQRVSLARACLYGGDVFLADEPFSSLDLKTKDEMERLFLRVLKERGTTTIFVTHDVNEAIFMSDRIVVLKDGTIASDIALEGEPGREEDPAIRRKLIDCLMSA